MVSTWLWCKSRSRIAVATTGSANTGAPFGNAAARRDQHGAGFAAAADQLEEQMRRVGLQRQVAKFVDDQQLSLRQRCVSAWGLKVIGMGVPSSRFNEINGLKGSHDADWIFRSAFTFRER
jgi:hypothetical protein